MKLTICAWLIATCLSAQTSTFTLSGPTSIVAGNAATVTLGMNGSSGQSIAAVQWTLTLPSGVTMGIPAAAPAWSAAGDQAYCNVTSGICMVVGSLTVMADGAIASIPLTIPAATPPGTLSLPLTGLLAATPEGNSVGLMSGAPYTLKVLSPCDLNGDGSITVADVQTMINAVLGLATCPAGIGTCNLAAVVYEIIAAGGGVCKLP